MFSSYLMSPGVATLAVAAAFAVPVHAADPEYGNSPALVRIKADVAHARGVSGMGVTIAVMDTGIVGGHREFAGGRLMPGLNAITGGSDVTDRAGHGTHVAGILGAARDGRGVLGVAYDARLLPIKILPDGGSGSTVALDRGLRYAIGRAAIVNMSAGAANIYDSRALQEAARAGLLIVAAAGNGGAASPDWPARFAKEVWAGNRIVAVGAVDAANRIAPFSNRAGDAAAWFLVAPGTGIVSSYRNGQYAAMSGTSMAAPMVSGAAALVMQLWPALRADQVATILLVTATDLGAPGIDAVYGRGLLNIEKALQPIGALTSATYNGKIIRVLAGSMQPSAATSALWSLAASGQLRVVGFDDFRRDFGIDLGATVARPAVLSLEQVLDNMSRRIDVAEQVLADGDEIRVAYARNRLAAFSLRRRDRDGFETVFGSGGLATAYFGAGDLKPAPGVALAQVAALSNPYFTLAPEASHAALAQEIGGIKLKIGVIASAFGRPPAPRDVALPSSATLPQAQSALFELSRSFDGAALSLLVSQTRETNAYLGSYSSGALSLGSRASTSALQLAGAVMLAPKLALAAQAAYGATPGGTSSDGLITEVTAARTNAFALALVAADRVKAGDRLSLSLSQPMRAYAGRIVMDVLSGAQARERLVFSMAPVGREMRAELNYQAPAGPLASFGLSLVLRHEPNNLVDAATEKLLALRYAQQF